MNLKNLKPSLEPCVRVVKDSGKISLELFKIMIPVLILVRILQELGWIQYLALPLEPLMKIVGLPAEMGLVWATALLNNIYGAAVVFLSLAPDHSLSVAQITVLTTMILVGHAIPVEVRIAQKAGNRFWFQALMRIGGALVLGFILHWFYFLTGWLQQESAVFWQGEITRHPDLLTWALDQVRNLVFIFLIILALMSLLRILGSLRITDFIMRLLHPPLRMLGIGREASFLTVVGMLMGLTYGGGLIIHEARSGHVKPGDVFASVTLMGLTHSLIEDTLLMVMLGGHISGLLFARMIFSVAVVALLVRGLSFIPDSFIHRFLYRMPQETD
ncbi:MAG: nucleoside recognition domain-containing protein [Desulfosalsimonas sp.]